MKPKALVLLASIALGCLPAGAATGIWGGYLTVLDGTLATKYKSGSTYPGGESVFHGLNLGTFQPSATLNLVQMETLTFQNGGHSTFEFAFAYRIRPSSTGISTNPVDYNFLVANTGDPHGVPIGGGDEKGEWTGAVNLLLGLAPGDYSLDVIHKAGAWEGGSNFERLGNFSNPSPGSTSWGSTTPFTASFTVVPEPAAALLGSLGLLALLRRRRR